MQKLLSLILVAGAAGLAAAALYDATWLTQVLGLPVERGEALVALAALSLSAVLAAAGVLGWRGRRHGTATPSAH
jgi:hypothetical protein